MAIPYIPCDAGADVAEAVNNGCSEEELAFVVVSAPEYDDIQVAKLHFGYKVKKNKIK